MTDFPPPYMKTIPLAEAPEWMQQWAANIKRANVQHVTSIFRGQIRVEL